MPRPLLRVGQYVDIKAGRYKTPYDDRIRRYQSQQGRIGFPGNAFGGCPPTGTEIQEHSTCWVKIEAVGRDRHLRDYIEVPVDDLSPAVTAETLENEFKERLKRLQKKCLHFDVNERYREKQVSAFYEMDSPSWRPEYNIYDTYQCGLCRAFLKPNTSKKKNSPKWTPGDKAGYLRKY